MENTRLNHLEPVFTPVRDSMPRRPVNVWLSVGKIILAVLCAWPAGADDSATAPSSETGDPFMGDWSGRWQSGEEKHPDITAQVIALGKNEYRVILAEALYQRVPPVAILAATGDGDVLRFDDGLYFGEIKGDLFSGGRRGGEEGAFTLERFALTPPSLGAPPPDEAIVLFNGSGFEQWRRFPKGSNWDILDGGILQANPALNSIETRRTFKDCRLHLEFRVPLLPEARGQERGNSGVFLQEYYEIQILDSYGLPGYWNECGAIYRISAPYVNMCLPPLQWQTYDIEFRAARFDEQGNLLEKARVTVLHNGVAVQKDHEIPRGTSGDATKPPVPAVKEPGPIRLQAHKNRVQFRNIWVVDLSAQS